MTQTTIDITEAEIERANEAIEAAEAEFIATLTLKSIEREFDKVEDLLRQALHLGCSFDCGTAYITRAYIDEQDDIVRRAVELGVIPERSVVPNRRDYRRD